MIVAIATGMIVLAGEVSNGAVAPKTDRVPPAPIGRRQPTAGDVPGEQAMKKMDQDLDRKVKSICHGC